MTPNNLKLNPNPPKEWRVVWEIDILAGTAEDAAREARDIQRDPRSIASVFLVGNPQRELDVFETIDLGEIDPVPEIPTAPAPVGNPIDHPEQAEREGWGLFGVDGRYQILMLDDPSYRPPEQLESDGAALAFVGHRATNGSRYHQAALDLVGQLVPRFTPPANPTAATPWHPRAAQ